MNRAISRRDFLNGVALTIGGTVLPPAALAFDEAPYAPERAPGYYPPALMGMRGNHDGCYTYAHGCATATSWNAARARRRARARRTIWSSWEAASADLPPPISIASSRRQCRAKNFTRRASSSSTITTTSEATPSATNFASAIARCSRTAAPCRSSSPPIYSKVAMGLLVDLGIDTQQVLQGFRPHALQQLGTAMFYDAPRSAKIASCPAWARRRGPNSWRSRRCPKPCATTLSASTPRRKIICPASTRKQKIEKLRKTSYSDFLTKICGLNPAALPFFQTYTNDLFAVEYRRRVGHGLLSDGRRLRRDDLSRFRWPRA